MSRTPPHRHAGAIYDESGTVTGTATMRPVEASPLPGDEEVAREIEGVSAVDGRWVEKVAAILARHREQATVPLREALESLHGILCRTEAPTSHKPVFRELHQIVNDALAAHPTKAESQEVEHA